MKPDSQYIYHDKAWTKTRDMAGQWLFSCPDHTSFREAIDYMSPNPPRSNKWQLLDEREAPPRGCDLCASEERMFGES